MSKYEKLASFIITNIGGKDNIDNVSHCMTRLRIKLKKHSKINTEELEKNKGIISTQEAEGKLQIIIGTHVGEVYEDIIRLTEGQYASNNDEKKGSFINRFAALITRIVVPSLGVLCACGIIAGLNSILLSTGIISAGDGTNIILNAIGNACLTFFPIILGYTSAVAFGMDPFIGMILGAVLVFPGIAESINSGEIMNTAFADSVFAMPIYKTFFGIPIIFPSNGYTATVIPIMLVNFFASKIEKILKEYLPAVTKQFIVPFLTILFAAVLGILIIGPISMIIQNGLQAVLSILISKSLILAFAVITLIYQPLVIFGLHWPLITLGIMEFTSIGNSLIIASIFPASFAHMAACLAVFLKTKSIKMKNIAFPAFLSACFCIIEPSIYGVTLPVKKRFVYCMLGGLVGGLILALTNSSMFAVSMGVTGFMAFVNPASNSFAGVMWCVFAVLSAMAVTFTLTWITYKPGEDGKNESDIEENKKTLSNREVIYSPMKGQVVSISEMNDDVFANETLGKGICIIPDEGKIVSPVNGKIVSLFPTGHAFGIKSDDGTEVLIHVGTNTFDISENIFTKNKNQGDYVKIGDPIIEFDMKKLEENGYNKKTAIIITNSNNYLDIIKTTKTQINFGEDILIAINVKS